MEEFYYTLISRDEDGGWSIEFGDWDEETVQDEKDDLVDSGHEYNELMIIRTNTESQHEIERAVANFEQFGS